MDILCARFVPAINNGGCQPAIMERPMTDEKTLPPLTLDDVRVVEPDRDAEEAFDAKETWIAACDRIQAGYPAADVADLLMQLDDDERGAVADYWRDHTLDTIGSPGLDGRDFHCPDIRLALAMQEREPDCDEWTCAPTLDPASLWETVVEFDRLQAENARLRAALALAGPFMEGFEGDECQGGDFPAQLAQVRAAMGKEDPR